MLTSSKDRTQEQGTRCLWASKTPTRRNVRSRLPLPCVKSKSIRFNIFTLFCPKFCPIMTFQQASLHRTHRCIRRLRKKVWLGRVKVTTVVLPMGTCSVSVHFKSMIDEDHPSDFRRTIVRYRRPCKRRRPWICQQIRQVKAVR